MTKPIYIISRNINTPVEEMSKTYARNTKELTSIIESYFEEKERKLLDVKIIELTQKIICTYINQSGDKDVIEFIYTEFKSIKK